ncbi:hypothetical protein [Alkalibacterium sp. 20]|uniref:hypothetical protein n=1 Tax=Alkalibacterium sp. 20 TaxID=1798803 RepID=UPI000A923DBE|nr:hypothetical protein [Alkalibacterium sp. 20]
MKYKILRYVILAFFILFGLFFVWQLIALNGRLTLFSILLFIATLFSYYTSKYMLKDED